MSNALNEWKRAPSGVVEVSVMKRTLTQQWTKTGAQLLMAACVVFASLTGMGLESVRPVAQTTSAPFVPAIEEARAEFSRLSLQLEGLRDERAGLLGEYEALTGRIEARKRDRDRAALLGDLELGNMLSDARALADRLYALQKRVRAREATLEEARRRLLAAYDERIAMMEARALESSDALAQEEMLRSLTALHGAREAYVARGAATPDLELGRLPSLDAALPDDPEEAQAQAAELDDARAKVHDRIDGIQDEIDRLEQQRRLRRKASDFRDGESFFDDATVGGRRVARAQVATSGERADRGDDQSDDVASEAGAEATGAPNDPRDSDSVNNQSEAPSNDPPPEGDPFNDGDDGEDAPDLVDGPGGAVGDEQEDFEAESGAGGGDGGPEPGDSQPEVIPSSDLPLDPFTNDAVVIQGGVRADAGVAGEGGERDDSLESQIQRLERDKATLERRSRELESRSDALKRRALGD